MLQILAIEFQWNQDEGYIPEVIFSPKGTISFKGRFNPKNPTRFFENLFVWINKYIKTPAPMTTVIIDLDYIEVTSQMLLIELFELLLPIAKTTNTRYIVEYDDESMLEIGKVFKSCLKELQIEIVEKL